MRAGCDGLEGVRPGAEPAAAPRRREGVGSDAVRRYQLDHRLVQRVDEQVAARRDADVERVDVAADGYRRLHRAAPDDEPEGAGDGARNLDAARGRGRAVVVGVAVGVRLAVVARERGRLEARRVRHGPRAVEQQHGHGRAHPAVVAVRGLRLDDVGPLGPPSARERAGGAGRNVAVEDATRPVALGEVRVIDRQRGLARGAVLAGDAATPEGVRPLAPTDSEEAVRREAPAVHVHDLAGRAGVDQLGLICHSQPPSSRPDRTSAGPCPRV